MNVTICRIALLGAVLTTTLPLAPCRLSVAQTSPDDRERDRIDVSAALQELREIQTQMESVARRLEASDTSDQTQTVQQNILAQLDEMIQSQQDRQQQERSEAEPQPPSDDGSEPGNGSLPDQSGQGSPGGSESVDRDRPVDRTLLMRRAWGHLPPRVRSQMQSALGEQFLPKYEKLIEDYYKRLAERKNDST